MNQIFALRRILSTQPRASRRHKDLLKSHREGSALVEMAVVVPLMLTLITGMASFGRGQSRGPRSLSDIEFSPFRINNLRNIPNCVTG